MSNQLQKWIFLVVLLLTYGLLFYFFVNLELNSDFTSFYASSLAYTQDRNPYQGIPNSFLPHSTHLLIDLNPPFFLELFAPLTHLTFVTASILWFFTSLILGGIGAALSFFIFSSSAMFKKYWGHFILFYLAMYPTMINIIFGQLGNFLLFFIALGYYFFARKKRDCLAGFFWGIIVAIKLFPALLFFFALVQNRYKLFWAMLLTAVCASLIPLLTHGFKIYTLYFKTLHDVLWFGNSWNASIYGFLYRSFINVDAQPNFLLIKMAYLIIFIGLLIWYIKKIHFFQKIAQPNYAFCLTVIMMLLLSPFGWLYYFPLLLMPLMLVEQGLSSAVFFRSHKKVNSLYNLWILCLFLICFPLGNVQARYMGLFISKITIYSIYFYGLVLLVYLLNTTYHFTPHKREPHTHVAALFPLKIFLSLGLGVVLIIFIMHFYHIII
ncbi:glycosyltransferase family 87 protein [Legionella maceachernii]|uniref:Mannosyltransferase n=1 Tax=Legionella maceachernii TaxID=466 RepID=A0A0W0W4B3_9GAMM|nr:glycosyltransferase family 87 protein [Legionella maceachernii]KTD27178.1 hypothetical protein Lmac_1426 [Legionella maceachernii]SKA13517.1 Protein of unknown function [Legionella maceachernii]SUP04783.1 Protein of uncharacterised function (DUF2029) [Legionella maceachernii]